MAKSAKIGSFWTMPLTALFERLDTVKSLLSIVKMEATFLRDGVEASVPVEDGRPW